MLLYLLFFATAVGVVVIAVDPGDPDVMRRPPNPKLPIANRTAVTMWFVHAAVMFLAALVPLVAGPDEPSADRAGAPITMTFAVLGFGTVLNAITNRRDPTSGLAPPVVKAVGISFITVMLIFLGTELPRLQADLMTTSLTGMEWLAVLGLALALPAVIEGGKWIRRRRTRETRRPKTGRVVALDRE
jgi:Ca2+-transporting ATPase